jgi:hypothetical protein
MHKLNSHKSLESPARAEQNSRRILNFTTTMEDSNGQTPGLTGLSDNSIGWNQLIPSSAVNGKTTNKQSLNICFTQTNLVQPPPAKELTPLQAGEQVRMAPYTQGPR